VILNLLDGDVPALHGMALSAVRAHLAAVNIGVAIGAILGDVGEDGLYVTLNAVRLFVQAAQGIFSLVVIEFGHGTDGAPSCGGVAILTGDSEGPVGTAGGLVLGSGGRVRKSEVVWRGLRRGGGERQQGPQNELKQSERVPPPVP
jgi:hypothetical protein